MGGCISTLLFFVLAIGAIVFVIWMISQWLQNLKLERELENKRESDRLADRAIREADRIAAKAAREAERLRDLEAQKRLGEQLTVINGDSLSALEAMPPTVE